MEMHSVDSTESGENKKIQPQRLPPVVIKPRASDFNALHATV